MKMYVTMSQVHRHEINGKVIDKDCIALLEFSHNDRHEARRKALELFGNKFCFWYFDLSQEKLAEKLQYFSRGVVRVCS